MVLFFGRVWRAWGFIPMEFWGRVSFFLDIRYVMHVSTTRAICFSDDYMIVSFVSLMAVVMGI